jgi:hypothetical protein
VETSLSQGEPAGQGADLLRAISPVMSLHDVLALVSCRLHFREGGWIAEFQDPWTGPGRLSRHQKLRWGAGDMRILWGLHSLSLLSAAPGWCRGHHSSLGPPEASSPEGKTLISAALSLQGL